MGVDYRIEIRRKADKKLLGTVDANCLKTIFDSGLQDKLHLEGRSSDGYEFTTDDIDSCIDAAKTKIGKCWDAILEKKLMIPLASNAEVKQELEEDIGYVKDDIEDYMSVISACSKLYGLIDCVTESLYKTEVKDGKSEDLPAYIFNGSDLPKTKITYTDGTECEQSAYIWNHDVVCIVRADY